jgi:hypothetical protein
MNTSVTGRQLGMEWIVTSQKKGAFSVLEWEKLERKSERLARHKCG